MTRSFPRHRLTSQRLHHDLMVTTDTAHYPTCPSTIPSYVVWHPDDDVVPRSATSSLRHFHRPPTQDSPGGPVEVYLRALPGMVTSDRPRPSRSTSPLPAGRPAAQIKP